MKNRITFFTLVLLIVAIAACSKNDPPLPDNTVAFESSALGFDADDTAKTIKVTIARALQTAATVTVQVQDSGFVSGGAYTVEPAVSNGQVALTIPAGSTSADIVVKRNAGYLLDGNEHISFTLANASGGLVVSSANTAKLRFSAIVSTGATLTLNGIAGSEAGTAAANSIFLDFSTNTQTAVLRTSWDLGFFNGDDYRVVINNTTGATAKATTKTDLSQITAADTAGFSSLLVLGQGQGSFDVIDNIYGDLSKTVIGAVSATESENKVYIIRPTNGMVAADKDWYKVKINRSAAGGYTLQYAKLSESMVHTLDIDKKQNYNFSYVSFDQGSTTTVEPEKEKWDIEWTLTTYQATPTIPYTYSDFIYINGRGGVQSAEIMASDISYANYNASHIATTNFTDSLTEIGATWRSTSPATGVRKDRFYVIKDPAGNVYKLQFISMGAGDGGTRGKPVLEYALVK